MKGSRRSLTAAFSGLVAALVCAHGAAAPAAAPAAASVPEVAFTTRHIKTVVEPGVGEITLEYPFTNAADLPVVVEEFVHSCGCMLGEWDGRPVPVGDKGVIRARFLTKGLRGTVTKSLRLRFVSLGTVELSAEVTIPETITYSAQTLRWAVGGAAEARRVDIMVNTKEPVRVLSVTGGDPAFACHLETVEDGRRYRVTLTPADTAAERVCVLQVRTDAKDPRDALQGLFALVERPVTPPATPTKGVAP